MRITQILQLDNKEKPIKIPLNYRQHVLAFIKEAIKNSGTDGLTYYQNLFSSNKIKLYTFSTYFPGGTLVGKTINIKDSYFLVYISSPDIDFLTRIYKGSQAVENSYSIFGYKIIKIVSHIDKDKIRFDNNILVKTVSPVVLRSKEGKHLVIDSSQNKFDFKNEKVTTKVSKEEFLKTLQENIQFLLRTNNLNQQVKIDLKYIQLKPIRHGFSNKVSLLFPAYDMVLNIEGDSKALTYILSTGIGSRRGEGFGMLKEICYGS